MDRWERQSLDNYITGHYGEDQFRGPATCPDCKQEFESVVEYEDHECPNAQDPLDEVPNVM